MLQYNLYVLKSDHKIYYFVAVTLYGRECHPQGSIVNCDLTPLHQITVSFCYQLSVLPCIEIALLWDGVKNNMEFRKISKAIFSWRGILSVLCIVSLCHHIAVSFCCQLSVLPCIVLPSSTLFGVTVTQLDQDDNDDHCECDYINSSNVSIIFSRPTWEKSQISMKEGTNASENVTVVERPSLNQLLQNDYKKHPDPQYSC